ncbi:MAG TPA: glycosyltransferase [Candidatus Acidoferrum sp.]|nr:glycosyltransferase [Candidatus Acidoferrum sp.]
MRVLFDHQMPFSLAHGGFQTQIEHSKAGLEQIGVSTNYLRWWEDRQDCDILHLFGIAPTVYLDLAAGKHLHVVMTTLFTETCNRSDSRLRQQRFVTQTFLRLPFGGGVKQQLTWRAFQKCACNVVGLKAEQQVLECVYDVDPAKIAIVPLGLSDLFLQAGPAIRDETHLICTGTITERKHSVELAEFAQSTRVPVLFVGKPYSTSDPYWLRFERLIDNKLVKYQPHVSSIPEMIQLLKRARGFVIMSQHENWCLSAHEAVACGLPILVPDQKWSRERFGAEAQYFHEDVLRPANAETLRAFYERCPTLPSPKVRLYNWREVAAELLAVYRRVASTSR